MSIPSAFGVVLIGFIALGLMCCRKPKSFSRRDLIDRVNGFRYNPWRRP